MMAASLGGRIRYRVTYVSCLEIRAQAQRAYSLAAVSRNQVQGGIESGVVGPVPKILYSSLAKLSRDPWCAVGD